MPVFVFCVGHLKKTQKTPVSFAMSVCMSAYVNPALTGRICVKIYVGKLHGNLSHNYIVGIKRGKMWDTSLGDVSRFYIVDSDVSSSK